MADLTSPEKRAFERLGMSGGYVLDFSNRTFSDFVMDTTACASRACRCPRSGRSTDPAA